MRNFHRKPWLAWFAVALLVLLCGVLAVVQYRWIDEITEAESGRLHGALQSRLISLSRSFNEEISRSAYAVVPSSEQVDDLGREKAYAVQYTRWKESHERIFRRIALAIPEDGDFRLMTLDLDTSQFSKTEWPRDWEPMRAQLRRRLQGSGGMSLMLPRGPVLFEMPRFGPGGPGRGGREQDWMLLPELLNHHLGYAGKLDYEAEVVENADPSQVIFPLRSASKRAAGERADAAVSLLEIQPPGFRGRGGGGPPPNTDGARWKLLVRHNAGSIEALVARTRRRNLAISGSVLLLILATAALLVRFSRQAQRLAELQIQFVAGVSHELRTPLTVIRTAAFNLKGRMANKPEQVQRYGALIEAESEKLTALVEQVLRFASSTAGHVIRAREPVRMESILGGGLRVSLPESNSSSVTVERRMAPDLPLVLADELALRQALQNLVDNALKYGTEGGNWIGIFVEQVEEQVEITIADRGPGIPLAEQQHIFDPFFRGQRAVADQIHGSGLGLYLVKKIVEAHEGTIQIRSEPMKGTEFVIRIPVAPPEFQDEFANTLD